MLTWSLWLMLGPSVGSLWTPVSSMKVEEYVDQLRGFSIRSLLHTVNYLACLNLNYFVVLLLFVMLITTISYVGFFFSFSGKCYTGSLHLGSATSPTPTVQRFEISDLCCSFYIKLQTLSWIRHRKYWEKKLSLLWVFTSKMNIRKSRVTTEDNIKTNGSERVRYYFQIIRAVIYEMVVFFWLSAPNSC